MDIGERGWEVRKRNFDPVIKMASPCQTETISLTGNSCSLQCSHCQGYYLKFMTTPEQWVKKDSVTSYLVSGGCDEEGKIPLLKHKSFLEELSRKGKLNVHTGLVNPDDFKEISPFIHTVSFDFVLDTRVIKNIYHLNKTGKDYLDTFRNLRQHKRVVPHVLLGINQGQINGENKLVEVLGELKPEAVVFLVLVPLKETDFANFSPPPLDQISDILAKARIYLPAAELSLGCLRPNGPYRQELDCLAVKYGFNCLVNPSRKARELAVNLGLRITESKECCVL